MRETRNYKCNFPIQNIRFKGIVKKNLYGKFCSKVDKKKEFQYTIQKPFIKLKKKNNFRDGIS